MPGSSASISRLPSCSRMSTAGIHIPDSPEPRESPKLLAKARSISSLSLRIIENGLKLKRSRDGVVILPALNALLAVAVRCLSGLCCLPLNVLSISIVESRRASSTMLALPLCTPARPLQWRRGPADIHSGARNGAAEGARDGRRSKRSTLECAAGRVLAEDVAADRDTPALARSVRDGFAVRAIDLPGELAVIGEVRAGERYAGEVGAGTGGRDHDRRARCRRAPTRS